MRSTPKHIYDEIADERPPCERRALLNDHTCRGRSTMEHAFIYRGRQICKKWAIIRLCEYSHLGEGLNKRINEWIALQHATPEDLAEFPGKDWEQLKKHLNKLYGNPPRR